MSDIHILVNEATIALYIRNTEKIKANFTTMDGSCLVLNSKVDFIVRVTATICSGNSMEGGGRKTVMGKEDTNETRPSRTTGLM